VASILTGIACPTLDLPAPLSDGLLSYASTVLMIFDPS